MSVKVTDLEEVCLCEPRMPHRNFKQVPWEVLERSTKSFGEVVTTKCFVPIEPANY
jgi:hypothetical protein